MRARRCSKDRGEPSRTGGPASQVDVWILRALAFRERVWFPQRAWEMDVAFRDLLGRDLEEVTRRPPARVAVLIRRRLAALVASGIARDHDVFANAERLAGMLEWTRAHVLRRDGRTEHHEWLAAGPAGPREDLARHLLDACEGSGTVLAWNALFEKRCIGALTRCLPDLAPRLDALKARVRDLLPLVKRHVYHPDFRGSFSLKTVLPALLPGPGYDGLDIAEGGQASQVLEAMLLHGDTGGRDPSEVREDLLRYCEKDTKALLLLFRELERVSRAS